MVVWLAERMELCQTYAQRPLCWAVSLSTAQEPRHINKYKLPIKHHHWTVFCRLCQWSDRLYARHRGATAFITFHSFLQSLFSSSLGFCETVMTHSICWGASHFISPCLNTYCIQPFLYFLIVCQMNLPGALSVCLKHQRCFKKKIKFVGDLGHRSQNV